MSCIGCALSSDTLKYASPGHGGWGMVRAGMQIPESYQLFVCPFACGRHGALGAITHGIKDRLSYLYVDQTDIIEGYDRHILKGVADLLAILPKHPRMLFIFVSCLDDLIGTDHESLLAELSETYPDVDFQFGHMNPTSMGTKSPPAVTLHRKMYGILKRRPTHRKLVNRIGYFGAWDSQVETIDFLEFHGYEIRHVSGCKNYDEFLDMAEASLNLVVTPVARFAAREMETKLSIPYEFLPVAYRVEEIRAAYDKLCEVLKLEKTYSFDYMEKRVEEAAERARKSVGDIPIIVCTSSTVRPYSMARALLEYGLPVKRIMVQENSPIEKGDNEWVMENHPEVEVIPPLHHLMVNRPYIFPDSISIGVEGAYLSESKYVVDVSGDEGMYGFRGLEMLLNMLAEAAKAPVNLREIIESQGLVV